MLVPINPSELSLMFVSENRAFIEWSTFHVLHSWVGSWPYPQISLGLKGLAGTNQHISLLRTLIYYGNKILERCTVGPNL